MRQPVTTIDIRRDLVGLLPRLRRFAMTLAGGDAALADDMVQTVCQRAVAKSQQWNGEGRLESWVYTLARHQWHEGGRKRRARPAASKGNVTDIREAARERTGSDADAIHRMISEMPEGLSSIFLLVDVEAHSYQQAADVMGIQADSVPALLAAARLHFASLADEHHHRY